MMAPRNKSGPPKAAGAQIPTAMDQKVSPQQPHPAKALGAKSNARKQVYLPQNKIDASAAAQKASTTTKVFSTKVPPSSTAAKKLITKQKPSSVKAQSATKESVHPVAKEKALKKEQEKARRKEKEDERQRREVAQREAQAASGYMTSARKRKAMKQRATEHKQIAEEEAAKGIAEEMANREEIKVREEQERTAAEEARVDILPWYSSGRIVSYLAWLFNLDSKTE
ncbi:hypothetical protein K402DRAFT_17264 [Aulographum hederae CBS 113979]|uniref:Uncharacterized protein n=1 Tax=Aulographum hederae CBS 113979 TaxID=1176131 RepID=A0A6G1H8E0_9PEZI|nr:hypothetical protein K402DRAFT_17264 [Aulographum hederae CBS 113979]